MPSLCTRTIKQNDSDTLWHTASSKTDFERRPESRTYEVRFVYRFRVPDFQCDETPSVSWNREVKPWTERSDSACCCTPFPVDIGRYTLRMHGDMGKWSFSSDKHTHISSLRWTGKVTWSSREQHISICVKNERRIYDQKTPSSRFRAKHVPLAIWHSWTGA